MTKGFLVSAARKSSGKTVVSLGIGAALKKRGLVVQPYKKGPDYIDPNWHTRATGRDCLNLDFRLQSHSEVNNTFEHYRQDADVVYVEGNKGLFDGMDLEGRDCNAALAKHLNLPVVLVIDCEGITRGIAPLLQGYEHFDKQLTFAGLILNRVAGPRHEEKLIASVARYTDLKVFGTIRRSAHLGVDERHLGLVPSNEASGAKQLINVAAKQIEEQVDLDLLLARSATLIPIAEGKRNPNTEKTALRIGIARDKAFGFYYQDDLDAFRAHGVEVVEFDTINDQEIPLVDGLFLGGGFPETQIDLLSANKPMLNSIREFIEQGGSVYAECGGLMYLCRSIEYKGKLREGVGVLKADVKMQAKPVGRGYAQLLPTEAHPWEINQNHVVDCHEFHYSRLENIDPDLKYAYKVTRGYGVTGEFDGLIYKNVLANYSHQRNAGQNPWVSAFIQFIKR